MIGFRFFLNSTNWLRQSIGAVNCIVRRPTDGKLIGYNTDYVGAVTAIEDGLRGSCHVWQPSNFAINLVGSCYSEDVYFNYLLAGKHNGSSTTISPLAGKLFVVIGAGGAGKALAYGAKAKGARVVIANRTYGKLHDYFSFMKLKLKTC